MIFPMKMCFRCKETKPFTDFKRDKRMKDGYHSWCAECWRAYHRDRYKEMKKDPEKVEQRRKISAASARRRRKADPDRYNGHSRKYRHGIDQAAYEALMEAQQGLCAVQECGRAATDVDHDHQCCSGRRSCGECIRGLLCNPCNTALGSLGEDLDRLRGIVAYLEAGQRLKDTSR